jgi:hypothetical protein
LFILEGLMGLRSRLKKQVGRILDQFSGEHSDAAPETRTPYSRPGVPDDGAEVVMARLNRPKSLSAGGGASTEASTTGSADKKDK